jgi:hypothetical protein
MFFFSSAEVSLSKRSAPFFLTTVLFGVSLALRFWFSKHAVFTIDQQQIIDQGMRFYREGVLSPVGAAVVYTGSALPGALQSLLAGLCLTLSQGETWGLFFGVALLNTVAQALWLRILRPHFPRLSERGILDALLYLMPWPLIFVSPWNPSFLPIFAVSAWWGLSRLNLGFWPGFAFALGIGGALQLHLSFVILAIGFCVSLFFYRNLLLSAPLGSNEIPFRIKNTILFRIASGIVAGSFLPLLTLLPWIRLQLTSASSPTGQHSPLAALLRNIVFVPENLSLIPRFLTRYWSFASPELGRFISPGGQGILGFWPVSPLFWKMVGLFWFSVSVLTVTSLGYQWLCQVYASLKSIFVGEHERTRTQTPTPLATEQPPLVALLFLGVWVPFWSAFSFLFSVKEPVAQSIWLLAPLAGLPLFARWEQLRVRAKQRFRFEIGFWFFGSLASVIHLSVNYLGWVPR